MMRTLCLGISMQLLNFLRKRGNRVVIGLCWLYCSSIFVLYMPDQDPLAMVQDSFYGQALTMLLMMLYGMQLWQAENELNFSDVLELSIAKPAVFVLTKVMVLLILSLMLSMLIALSHAAAFLYMNMPAQVLLYALKMIGINYVLPMFSSALLGMIIGQLIASRAKYIALMLTWLITSPFSMEFTSHIMSLIGHDIPQLTYVFALFNLGARMQTGATPMYGIPFDPYRFLLACIKASLLLFWLMAMYVPAARSRHKALWHRGVSLCMLLVSLSMALGSFSTSTYKACIYAGIPEVKRAVYDNLYYYTRFYHAGTTVSENALPPFDATRYLTVSQMTITLEVGLLDMSVQCDMLATAQADTAQQSFTLYRDFNVDAILLNGEAQPFEQDGDYVNLVFSRSIPAGEEITLSFSYSGSSSPIFTATKAAVYLSANFPWLPECGMRMPLTYSPYTQTDLFTLYSPAPPSAPIEYTLHFQAPYVAYVNLNRLAPTTWQGRSTDGVSVYSDALMACKPMADLMVYYPAAIEPKLDRILPIHLHSADILRDMEHMLGIDAAAPHDHLLVLPVLPVIEYAGVIRNYTMHEAMMLNFESGFYLEGYMSRSVDPGTTDAAALFDAAWALVNTPGCLRSFIEEPVNQLFIPFLIQWGCAQNNLSVTSHRQWMNLDAMRNWIAADNAAYTAEELDTMDQIIPLLRHHIASGSEQAQALLKAWYADINAAKPLTPDELLDRLQEEDIG